MKGDEEMKKADKEDGWFFPPFLFSAFISDFLFLFLFFFFSSRSVALVANASKKTRTETHRHTTHKEKEERRSKRPAKRSDEWKQPCGPCKRLARRKRDAPRSPERWAARTRFRTRFVGPFCAFLFFPRAFPHAQPDADPQTHRRLFPVLSHHLSRTLSRLSFRPQSLSLRHHPLHQLCFLSLHFSRPFFRLSFSRFLPITIPILPPSITKHALTLTR